MMDDQQLLARYVKTGSQEAFAELVARHLNFVYSTALRHVQSAELAEDVTQIVFTNLARKAASLSDQVILAGWLHRDTRFTALDMLRTERRRQAREQEAVSMNTADELNSDLHWEQVRPWIDEALNEMNPLDRDAILLRFFEKRSLKEIGVALGAGEDAARKRVARALDKLRELLARRGLTTSASALSIVIAANAVQAAPGSLAGTIVASSLAAGGVIATGVTTLHLLPSITMAHLKCILAAVAVVALTTAVIQHIGVSKLRDENRALREQNQKLVQLQQENESLSKLDLQTQNPSLSAEQMKELLRLRGEVGKLRKVLTADNKPNPATDAKDAPEESSQPYTTQLTARVGNGQTLVAGGWATVSGKRTFLVMTPNISPMESTDTPPPGSSPTETPKGKMMINTVKAEIPESMLAQFGIDQLKADGRDSSAQMVLTGGNAEALLKMLNAPIDGVVAMYSTIKTSDGITSTMSLVPLGQNSQTNGEPQVTPYTIGITPNLSADLQTANMSINAQFTPASTP